MFSEEIKLNVAAFDSLGNAVNEVTKSDLVIIEDGRLHRAESVQKIPADVLIVLDTGGQMRRAKSISRTREIAKQLIRKLSSTTTIATLEYHDKARLLTEWTKDRERLNSDLDRKLHFGKRSRFTTALGLATEVLKRSKNENRHLVLISDGTDTIWSDSKRGEAMTGVLETNINVHVVSYTRLEQIELAPSVNPVRKGDGRTTLPPEVIATLPEANRRVASTPNSVSVSTDREFLKTMNRRKSDLEKAEDFLRTLSVDTSGIYLQPDTYDEIADKIYLISNAIESNYVVTYIPRRALAESKPGETRSIEVNSKRQGLFVASKRKLVISQPAETP